MDEYKTTGQQIIYSIQPNYQSFPRYYRSEGARAAYPVRIHVSHVHLFML